MNLPARFLAIGGWLAGLWLCSCAGEPLWVAVGDGDRRLVSADGLHWQASPPRSDPHIRLHAITYGAGRFVAIGKSFDRGGESKGLIAVSEDGQSWRDWRQPALVPEALIYGAARFLFLGGANLVVWRDGESLPHATPSFDLAASGCRGLACGDTEAGFRFVAIGESEDGQAWRAATSDGLRWDIPPHPAPLASGIAYGAGHFVVVGPKGLIESSHDGQTWVPRRADDAEHFEQVFWTGKKFLARGRRTWASADGFSWTVREPPLPRSLWLREGVGGLAVDGNGALLFSRDLRSWQPALVPPGGPVLAAAYRDE